MTAVLIVAWSSVRPAAAQCRFEQIARLTASDPAPDNLYGASVAVSGDYAIVGASRDDDRGDNSGAAYVFGRIGDAWEQIDKLVPLSLAAGDAFGSCVAMHGSYALVGAPGANRAYLFEQTGGVWQQVALFSKATGFGDSVAISENTFVVGSYRDGEGGVNSGAAYVYRRVAGVWQQAAKLRAGDAAANDLFGWSVGVSGGTVIVGAHENDDAGPNSGSAYVFQEVGGTWQQVTKLVPGDLAASDAFGRSVSISGSTAVVGAHSKGQERGAVYVYRDVAGTWSQIDKLTAADGLVRDWLGFEVAISGDTIVAGARLDDDANAESGSAYVFREVGDTWLQIAELHASDATDGADFSQDVCVSGGTVIVGAPAGNYPFGAAYVFDVAFSTTDCNGNGTPDECELIEGDCDANGILDECELAGRDCNFNGILDGCELAAKRYASDAGHHDEFGASISLSGDTAIIGARLNDDYGNDSGAAYVFRRTDGLWQQYDKLTASDAAAGDWFGGSVSVSGDTAVVGAYWDDNAGGRDSGSAYVFREAGGSWEQAAKLAPLDADPNLAFGYSVAIDGSTAVVGAIEDDIGEKNTGSAYVFREIAGTWQQVAKLTASDPGRFDLFGYSVAISGDTTLVGAWAADTHHEYTGAVYVFREIGGVWTQLAKLAPDLETDGSGFGVSVALDGDTALIGMRGGVGNAHSSGVAFVFREIDGVWERIAKLSAADAHSSDFFGTSVSLSGDIAVVGANGTDDRGSRSGTAYVFQETTLGWRQVARRKAIDAAAADHFGTAVATDGVTAIVGAEGDDDAGGGSGAVYFLNFAVDCNGNRRFDTCDLASVGFDVNANGVLDACECLGDITGDRTVDLNDLAIMLSAFGCTGPGCAADLDGDGDTDLADLSLMLARFGQPCS